MLGEQQVLEIRRASDDDPLGALAMPEVGVIGLVPDEWGWPWMARQQILTRLCRYFRVVWVDPPRGWREQWLPQEQQAPAARVEHPEEYPGFTVYRPGKWLPQLYRPHALADFTAARRLKNAVGLLSEQGCKKIILYLWRPQFANALRFVKHDLSCYHIDDEYSFSEAEVPNGSEEMALIEQADEVIIHSEGLMEKKGGINPNTRLVPNGVDFDLFATPDQEPQDIQPIPHPRIGYVGMIKKQLDFDMLLKLARRHPEWSFVMVGARGYLGEETPTVDALSQLPNVWFLGKKSVRELPAYVQHLDVCTMCYKIDDYTKYIYPLKLHEYLASGRPVVATPIRSLQAFSGVIELADTEDEWSQAISKALANHEQSAQRIDERRRVAKQHDWDLIAFRVAEMFCERLGPEYVARLQRYRPS